MEEVVDPAAAIASSSSPAAFEAALPTAEPTETERRLRIYKDGSEDSQDDNGMAAMLSSSINTAHGSELNGSNDAQASKEERKNNKLFGTKLDQRDNFIDEMSHLSDKQLRVQLWDSFRLARVILGKPVKDKRKLSHKSILHAIRKTAEMKIQIIRMSEELDRYQQREKKWRRRKSKIPQPGKENTESQEVARKSLTEDSLSTASVFSPSSSIDGDSRSISSIRDVGSDNSSPSFATTTKLRAQAIQILQEESDLALSQIQEIDQQRQKKRRRFDDSGSLLESPPRSPAAGALFLSPSESDDDYSYTGESASDILFPFRGKPSPNRKQDLESILEPDAVTYGNEADEIRHVLQKVVDYEQQSQGDPPEVTTGESSATQIHKEVIALLTRLTPTAPKASPKSKAETKQSPAAVEEETKKLPAKKLQVEAETTNVVAMDEDTNNEVSDEVLPSAEAPLKEAEAVAPMEIVDEAEDEEIVMCQAQLSAAKVKEAESIETLKQLNLQKEILQEDIAIARKNTTRNREKVQLKRLNEYKKQLQFLLKQKEEQSKQMESLDSELNDLATVCVKLEDREADFQAKHEKHMAALKDFEIVTRRQTENFRSLMGSIDRGIKEQTAIVFGEKDDDTKSLPSEGSGSFDADNDMAAQTIQQRLEYLLTKQNMEVFRLKAQLRMQGGKTREEKAKEGKRKSRIKW